MRVHTPCTTVRPGTVVLDASGQPRVIVRLDPYIGPLSCVYATARDATGWGISLTTPGHTWIEESP